ncbi:SH3 domain-containing protein [Roseomonas sp. F4]
MRKAVVPVIALSVLALAAGGAFALGWGGAVDEGVTPEAAAGRPADAQAEAVSALRAHLTRTGVQGEVRDIAIFPTQVTGEYAICGRLVGADGVQGDLVARVLPAPPIRMVSGETVRARASMVVLEDGPGLWRGGAQGLPRQRLCGAPAATQPIATPAAAVVDQPVVAQPMAAAAPAGIAAGEAASGTATVTSAVRVRAAPSAGADILWVAERGRSFTVHAQAPGGWIQIGDATAPAGWAHGSLLTTSN